MSCVAVIPARGGSKRIPRKNIRPFAGLPMLAHGIKAAHESGLFDEVMVSTEDPEIAEVAKQCGAVIPFMRPTSLADDYTGTQAIMKQTLEAYGQQGRSFHHACCIYATNPFLKPEFLASGLLQLQKNATRYAFAITSFPFPVQRSLVLDSAGCVSPAHPEYTMTRSQDLEEHYHDAGQFYWGDSDAFLTDLPLYAPHSSGVIIPRHLVQDIDTEEDWTRAEFMYQALQQAGELT
ncbi:pseudaminic acid cytidylyltransferase [Corallincola platygyrae]|uniref:Pseudaminic acid cytidylyltransferase n=1 Tax=Corallincola platygyrae TaxID=1193278 RepID=A0ABW4XH31_9GAMM